MDKEKLIAYSNDICCWLDCVVVRSETIVHIYIYCLYQVLSDPACQHGNTNNKFRHLQFVCEATNTQSPVFLHHLLVGIDYFVRKGGGGGRRGAVT